MKPDYGNDRQRQDEERFWYEEGPGSESWKQHRAYLQELKEIDQSLKDKKHGYDAIFRF